MNKNYNKYIFLVACVLFCMCTIGQLFCAYSMTAQDINNLDRVITKSQTRVFCNTKNVVRYEICILNNEYINKLTLVPTINSDKKMNIENIGFEDSTLYGWRYIYTAKKNINFNKLHKIQHFTMYANDAFYLNIYRNNKKYDLLCSIYCNFNDKDNVQFMIPDKKYDMNIFLCRTEYGKNIILIGNDENQEYMNNDEISNYVTKLLNSTDYEAIGEITDFMLIDKKNKRKTGTTKSTPDNSITTTVTETVTTDGNQDVSDNLGVHEQKANQSEGFFKKCCCTIKRWFGK